MAKKKKTTRYRDRETGRFVAKKTWQRSRARGGRRYKRSLIVSSPKAKRAQAKARKTRPRALPEPEEVEREKEEIEFAGAFDSP